MNQKKCGILLSYMSQIVNILTGLLYTPYMLSSLGKAEYGLYSLASSTVSMLSVLNMGISGGYLFFYSKFSAEKDEKAIERFNAVYVLIFSFIAILCLLFGMLITFNLTFFFNNGLTTSEYQKAQILTLIMVLNMAISFPCNVFSSGIDANERFIFNNGYMLVSSICSLLVNIIVLSMGFGSVGLVLVTLIFTIIRLVVYSFYGIKIIKMRFEFKGIRLQVVRSLFVYTAFIFLNQLTNLINGQLDKILLGRFVGTTAVAIYSIGSVINIYYQTISSTVSSVFSPEINKVAAELTYSGDEAGGKKRLTHIFIKVSRMQAFLLMMVLTGFILFGKEFVILWAGKDYGDSYIIALCLMIAGSVSYFQTAGDSIQRALNKHQIRAVIYFLAAISNIIISIPLLIKWGAIGAAIGTMIVWILCDWFFLNFYYQYKLGLDMITYWKNMKSIFLTAIISLGIGFVLSKCISIDDWITLIIFGGIYILIYFLCCIKLGFNDSEKQMIRQMLVR